MSIPSPDLSSLASRLTSEFHFDRAMRAIYASDYQDPGTVTLPRTEADLRELIAFANLHRLGLVSRRSGISVAGKGSGAAALLSTWAST